MVFAMLVCEMYTGVYLVSIKVFVAIAFLSFHNMS